MPTRATTRCTPNGVCFLPRQPIVSRRRGLPAGESLQSEPRACASWRAATENGEVRPFAGETRLYILPGHRFQAIDLLLTNFHLPRSSLLMLVAALAGLDRIKAAYAHAVASDYRFFSYGDACLIERR
jgi:Queuosine biosynthesis protein